MYTVKQGDEPEIPKERKPNPPNPANMTNALLTGHLSHASMA